MKLLRDRRLTDDFATSPSRARVFHESQQGHAHRTALSRLESVNFLQRALVKDELPAIHSPGS
jgi:hypothetical protein